MADDAILYRGDGVIGAPGIRAADRPRIQPRRGTDPAEIRARDEARRAQLGPRGRMARPALATPGDGGRVVCERRPWRQHRNGPPLDLFRIRFQYDLTTRPPRHQGRRATEALTPTSVRHIADAVEWSHLQGAGMTTFLTLTLDEDARRRVADGETTIQRELKRFFDAATKARRRGFRAEPRELATGEDGRRHTVPGAGGKVRFGGTDAPFRYLWVAESPTNEHGEPNPHVHVLMAWSCDYGDAGEGRAAGWRFASWAGHLERLWGLGFAHLEKIKEPKAAATYCMKALGYLAKGQDGGQGVIEGNRYGISTAARAPKWEHEWTRELGVLPAVMKRAARWQKRTAAPKRADRDRLKAERRRTPRANKATHAQLTARIDKLRAELEGRPIIAGRYTVRTRGRDALHAFLSWAEGRPGPYQGTPVLPRRRPPRPYAGGPRPRSLAATLTAEHGAGLRRTRRQREQHEHEWRARLELAEAIPDELHDAPHPALPIEPPPGLLDYLHGALAA